MIMKLVTIIVIIVLLLLLSSAAAVDYREEYCRGNEYVGNGGVAYSYPHLHCGSNFFVLSRPDGGHTDLTDASKRQEILDNKTKEYGDARRPRDITRVLTRSLYSVISTLY